MVATALIRHFARKSPAVKQRQALGNWERSTNIQQRALLRAYDEWSTRTRRELTTLANKGATIPEQYEHFRSSLVLLESSLAEVSVRGVIRAGRVAAGKHFDDPIVQKAVEAEKDIARRLVAENLVPNIHESLLPIIASGQALSVQALAQGFGMGRPMAAQYAGGAWVAIFKVQKEMGSEHELDRISKGLPIEPVRWELDPNAAHCAHGADGFYGCPELAGEYPGGWSTLPTVPAGRVSCRGNCRCKISVLRNGKWSRGIYDD